MVVAVPRVGCVPRGALSGLVVGPEHDGAELGVRDLAEEQPEGDGGAEDDDGDDDEEGLDVLDVLHEHGDEPPGALEAAQERERLQHEHDGRAHADVDVDGVGTVRLEQDEPVWGDPPPSL